MVESNEGFLGGDDGENPPHDKSENHHTIAPSLKRRKNHNSSKEIEIF